MLLLIINSLLLDVIQAAGRENRPKLSYFESYCLILKALASLYKESKEIIKEGRGEIKDFLIAKTCDTRNITK